MVRCGLVLFSEILELSSPQRLCPQVSFTHDSKMKSGISQQEGEGLTSAGPARFSRFTVSLLILLSCLFLDHFCG